MPKETDVALFILQAGVIPVVHCSVFPGICYIAINTALSECCWYNGCQNDFWTTDISGTGYSCASRPEDELTQNKPDSIKGALYGSTTGWLATEWPIDPEEEFYITFYIHDTSDARLDSEVIIDKFQFVGKAEAGTVPVVVK